MTYIGDALEEDGFMAWPLGVPECADCLGTFVFVGGEEVVQPFMAQILEEPFSVSWEEVCHRSRLAASNTRKVIA